MSVDLAPLARSVRSLPGVRGCVLLSQDGLVLASDPESVEGEASAFWVRLGAIGDVQKGFVATDQCLWAFCQRGPYQLLVQADATVRPGVVLGAVEQALLAADQTRMQDREAMRSSAGRPSGGSTPPPRFRAPLHREPAVPPAPADEVVVVDGAGAQVRPPSTPSAAPGSVEAGSAHAKKAGEGEDWEVDNVQLAREFGGLYTEES